MALYTERHGMRKPIAKTDIISVEMYALLLDCCERYYEHLAWKFPEQCPDGHWCCGLHDGKFQRDMKFEIPTLYRDSYYGNITIPRLSYGADVEFDQYALLDLIEFTAQNCRDIFNRHWHKHFGHDDLSFAETNDIAHTFRNEINAIFQKVGLLYVLTDRLTVERIVEHSVTTEKVEVIVGAVSEKGLKDLLEEALLLFRQPNPANRNDAVEKLWDAFERLKSYYTSLNKKTSAEKIVKDMSSGQTEFEDLFNTEFKALTNIGNGFRIRHHETDKIEINDLRHYDYFFNRCLALLAAAIQYLHSSGGETVAQQDGCDCHK